MPALNGRRGATAPAQASVPSRIAPVAGTERKANVRRCIGRTGRRFDYARDAGYAQRERLWAS